MTAQATIRRTKVGIVLPIADEDDGKGVPSYTTVRKIALAAEHGGLDSLWVFDHLLFRTADGQESGIHECWTILAAIAEATRRVELGTIVLATAFRNPALQAKMAATLDEVSGGRLIFGIGSGWYEPEFAAFGYPFDHRVGRFEESLAVITGLIRTGRASLDGRWVRAEDAALIPPARPDLPILIAAKSPRMLELAARHADAWNLAWFGLPDERLARIRGELVDACVRVGRDPATLAITVGINVKFGAAAEPADAAPQPPNWLSGTPAMIAAGLRVHADAGASHLIAALEPTTTETVAEFAEALRLFRAGYGRRSASDQADDGA
jgi:alkanesulfonate monooxygenase SsuD/methylene tetrahydromethanopterin reductase-like flavin-dependent oxidoreductase (luciferase family)